MEVFKKHHGYPFTKLLTFPHRVEPFCFRGYYNKDVNTPHISNEIGEFVVNAVAPAESSEKVKVKVRVRLDINGCFTVSSASMVETLPPQPVENGETMETNETVTNGHPPEGEKMDVSNEEKEKSSAEQNTNNDTNNDEEMKQAPEKVKEPKEPKKAEA